MPFAAMMRAKYATSLAVDMLYRAGGIGEGVVVRVITQHPDRVVDMQGARLVTGTQVFKVLVEAVVAPATGDTLQARDAAGGFTGDLHEVQARPMRHDRHGLEWTLDMVPA